MLGRSKCVSQGKTTAKLTQAVNADNQRVELLPNIKTYYGNMQLAASVLHANEVPFLASISNHNHHSNTKAINNMKANALEFGL